MGPDLVDIGSWPIVAAAWLQILLVVFLLIRGEDRRANRWFALVGVATALWAWASGMGLASTTVEHAQLFARLAFVGIAVAGPATVAFANAITRAETRSARAWLGASAIVTVVLLVGPKELVPVAARLGGGYWPRLGPGSLLAAMVTLPSALIAFVDVARAARAMPPCRRRRRLSWSAAAIGFGLTSALDVRTLFVPDATPIQWIASVLSTLAQIYAMAQPRLVALSSFFRQLLLSTVVGAAGVAIVWLFVAVGPRGAVGGGAAALSVYLVVRLWVSGLEGGLNRLLQPRRRRVHQALLSFERDALEAHTVDDVAARLGEALRRGFGTRLVDLWAVDAAARRASDRGLEEALARDGTLLLADLLDLDRPDARRVGELLSARGAEAALPLIGDGELVGVALLAGPALRPADDFLVERLTQLGERAGHALVNARLYQEVARRSGSLEAEVEARTAALAQTVDELRLAQARLVEQERNSSLGLLVAGVSHEINNALNILSANLPSLSHYVSSFSAVIEAPGAPSPSPGLRRALQIAPEATADVREAIRHTSKSVADLRRFARPDTERRLVRVDEALGATVDLLRHRTEGRLTVTLIAHGAPSVEGYPGPLNHCFFNLLMNAIDAAQSEIWISTRDVPGGIEVTITDDREGLLPGVSERVFEPFVTTKRRRAGIGLTVSKRVVDRHGGAISIDSAPGAGATVRVFLPSRAPEEGAHAQAAAVGGAS
jgi:signal transduction histidine kinase